MSAVPTPATIYTGVSDSSEFNAGVRDVLLFLIGKPIAGLRQTAAQSIPNTTFTPVTFGAEDIDSANGHDNVTNNSRYTAVYAGWHLVAGGCGFVANVTGRRILAWYVNGSAVNGGQLSYPATAANDADYPARTMLVFLAIGDYVELNVYQESGGALNTASVTATLQAHMAVSWQRNA